MSWMNENISTIIVSILIVLIVILIIVKLRKDKKNGRLTCGGNCSGCAMSGKCHTSEKKEYRGK